MNELASIKEQLLSIRETATYLDLGIATLDRWRAKSYGPPWIRIGYRIYYRRADIDQWLAQQVNGGVK